MKIVDFIMCDDIRYELGNKVTLVGVYSDSIIFGEQKKSDVQWPKVMKLGFFIRSLFSVEERYPDKFEVDIFFDKEKKVSMSGVVNKVSVDDHNGYMITVAVVTDNFPFPGVGDVSAQVRYFEKEQLIAEGTPDTKLKVQVSLMPS